MLIASLSPFITALLQTLGVSESLVAASAQCDLAALKKELPRLTRAASLSANAASGLALRLSDAAVDLMALRNSNADIVLTSLGCEKAPQTEEENSTLEASLGLELSEAMGRTVRVRNYSPRRLEEIFSMYEKMGQDVGAAARGREIAQRTKAQMLDWCDNFYDRAKGKKVSLITAVDPLKIGGLWIPDMIEMLSCVSQEKKRAQPARVVSFEEILEFKPDVVLVAPEGLNLEQSARLFKYFETLPAWESLPAVKRGEVFFTEGLNNFRYPDLRIIDSMGILVSAMAGMDSGYITKRDSFYRLRWLELQRHRFV